MVTVLSSVTRLQRGLRGPDHASPDQASPDQASPDQASPDQASPDQASPDQAGVRRKVVAATASVTMSGVSASPAYFIL